MRAVVGVVMLSLVGCSYAFVEEPPKHPQPGEPIDCTDSYAAPIVDSVEAIGYVAYGAISAVTTAHCGGLGCLFDAVGVFAAIPAVVYGVSAVHGYRAVSACEDAREPPGITAADRAAEIAAAARARDARTLPVALDRDLVAPTLRAVENLALTCRTAFPGVTGVVRIHAYVAPNGQPQVVVDAAPVAGLGDCVARAVGRVAFPPTRRGGSFSYPFVFGTPAGGHGSP